MISVPLICGHEAVADEEAELLVCVMEMPMLLVVIGVPDAVEELDAGDIREASTAASIPALDRVSLNSLLKKQALIAAWYVTATQAKDVCALHALTQAMTLGSVCDEKAPGSVSVSQNITYCTPFGSA